jgi:hypothetical protein
MVDKKKFSFKSSQMNPKIEIEKGWTEAIIDDDCEFGKFYKVADILSNDFNVVFSKKVDDFDTLYWEFSYQGSDLVLHYNVYLGISIFPKAFKLATKENSKTVIAISSLLFQKIIDYNWSDFEKGKTIGTKGSEDGTIIKDIENSNGARITLEKECGNIPFAITLGIYNLMFHTHFEKNLEQANEYITQTKYKINKILDLYDIPEDNRDNYWHSKLDKQINELAEITEGETKTNIPYPQKELKWWQKFFK